MNTIAEPSKHKGWYTIKKGVKIKPSELFVQHRAAFNLKSGHLMKQQKVSKIDQLGYVHHTFQEYYRGLLVEPSYYKVHVRKGYVEKANGELAPQLRRLQIRPTINEQTALDIALNAVGATQYPWSLPTGTPLTGLPTQPTLPEGELLITWLKNKFYLRHEAASYALAYKFKILTTQPSGGYDVYIHAQTGEVIRKTSLLQNCFRHSANTLYDGKKGILVDAYTGNSNLNCTNEYWLYSDCLSDDCYNVGSSIKTRRYIKWQPSTDITTCGNNWNGGLNRVAASGHWAATKAYDYFYCTFGRNSFDDNGGEVDVNVDYEGDEAAWNYETNSILLGERGIAPPWQRAHSDLVSLDIVGHEFAHGVNQYTANLRGNEASEPAGLNEGFADIFGALVEFSYGDGDWLIGEDFWICDGYSRNMRSPNAKYDCTYNVAMQMPNDCTNPAYGGPGQNINFDPPSPDTYCGWYWGVYNFDPHFSAGVLNKWFFLLAEGQSGINDHGYVYSVQGVGLYRAAQIAYRTLTTKLGSTSGFPEAHIGSMQAAHELYGISSFVAQQNIEAWCAVGLCSNSYPANKKAIGELNKIIGLHNFPNPFVENTTLSFYLPETNMTSLHIYNSQGQKIQTIFSNEMLPEGQHQPQLQLTNVAEGIYYAVLSLNGTTVKVHKMMYIN